MKSLFVQDTITYTGEQLRSHFAYAQFGLTGDSIIAFCGMCDVKDSYVVDIEDAKAGNKIFSEWMLHFIIEHFDTDLEKTVVRQILFAHIVSDVINSEKGALLVTTNGSDLYDGDAKVSVSVATVSPVSSLIHFGINIRTENTPVKTKGLRDYGIEPSRFAAQVMDCYISAQEKIHSARSKVRWVE